MLIMDVPSPVPKSDATERCGSISADKKTQVAVWETTKETRSR